MPMHKENLAVFSLAADLISGQTGDISRVDYFPQKTVKPVFPPEREEYFRRVSPESVGISSSYIADFIRDAAADKNAHIHQLMILRHGSVITECSFYPYAEGVMHIEHSLSKSITGTAIGMLIDEGRLSLDTRLVDIMKNRISLLNTIKLKNLNIRHLLTMSSGVSFNESGAISGNDWVEGYLDSPLNFNPGAKFEYNSMNSYMLSAIVREITGVPMVEYLREKLFNPLHITDFMWESCPKGNTKGGWGLYMRPEDVMKIGYLYLQRGMWEGKRLLSDEWVQEATSKQINTDRDDGSGYAFQMWTGAKKGFFEFNGMLEQHCLVYPDMDMIIMTNAASSELFTLGSLKRLINRYFEDDFSPAGCLPENTAAEKKLLLTIKAVENRYTEYQTIERGGWGKLRRGVGKTAISSLMKSAAGKSYELDDRSSGLMPIMMQVFHNNFTDGITDISFVCENGQYNAVFHEGEAFYTIALGFREDVPGVLDFHDELYLISSGCSCASDEDGNPVLKLHITYIEEACTRSIKIFFKDDFRRIRIEMNEAPGEEVILGALESVTVAQDSGYIMTKFKDLGALDLFSKAATTKIRPVIHGRIIQNT